MTERKPYQVLLYYLYTPIENPEEFTAQHLAFCKELELKGRILIAAEGINGTVSGTVEQTDKYMETMKNDPRFEGIVFKIDEADEHAFKNARASPQRISNSSIRRRCESSSRNG